MDISVERPGARWWIPERPSLSNLRSEIDECKGCELYCDSTQGVMGNGNADAELMVLGEQPNEEDDRAGEPLAGAVGELLDRALGDAGIAPESVFRTNLVKHFRFSASHGLQRLPKAPSKVHVTACASWLLTELDVIRPTGVLVLGAVAAKALYSGRFRAGNARGEPLAWPEDYGASDKEHHRPEWVLTTTHPDAVLRSRERDADYEGLLADVRVAARLLSSH